MINNKRNVMMNNLHTDRPTPQQLRDMARVRDDVVAN